MFSDGWTMWRHAFFWLPRCSPRLRAFFVALASPSPALHGWTGEDLLNAGGPKTWTRPMDRGILLSRTPHSAQLLPGSSFPPSSLHTSCCCHLQVISQFFLCRLGMVLLLYSTCLKSAEGPRSQASCWIVGFHLTFGGNVVEVQLLNVKGFDYNSYGLRLKTIICLTTHSFLGTSPN